MYQNILVPVDGSDTVAKALREAIKLARSLPSRHSPVPVLLVRRS